MKDVRDLEVKIDEINSTLRRMRKRCIDAGREPSEVEINEAMTLLGEMRELQSWLNELEWENLRTGKDSISGEVFMQPAASGRNTMSGGKGYEIRGANDPKDFQSLFGPGLNKHTWTDKEISFFEAVFSPRAHPDLQARAMIEGVLADGGALVPVEYSREIHEVALENEIVMPRANVIPMKSNQIVLPAMEIGSHASHLYGGFVANFKGETESLTEASPKTRQMTLTANKLTGLVKMSNELFTDIPGGGDQVVQICGKGLAWYRDYYFLRGNGAGEPLGALNANCTIAQPKETGQASSTIVYENLAKMLSRLHPDCFNNAIWIAHPTCISELLSLSVPIGTAGSHYPVLRETDRGFRMLARPCVFSEKMQTLGTQGDILLADWSQYAVGLREEMRLDYSPHVYFTTDQIVARLISRFDAQPLWNSALTLKDGSTTVSPFVVLADR